MSDPGGAKQGGGYQGNKTNAWQRKPAFGGGGNTAASKPAVKENTGRCEELRGHMFDCGQPKHADMYNTTIEEIVNHVRVTFGEGDLVARAISSGKKVAIKKPAKPIAFIDDDGTVLEVDETDLEIWRAEIKDYVRTKRNYDSALQKTYGLVIGQCTQNLKANLESLENYADIQADADVLALLAAIKGLVFNFESTKCIADALVGSLKAFYRYSQPKTMSDEEFLKKYKSMYEVIVQSGGRIGYHPAMILQQLTKLGIAVTDKAGVMGALDQCVANAEDEYSAVHFLRMLNWERHGSLVTHLENQYTLGVDAYPKTLTAAYNLAIKWKKDTRGDPTPTDYRKPDEGVNLATDVEKGKKRDLSTVKCFNCNKHGHFARDCKEARVEKPAEAVNTTTTVPPSDLSAVTNASGGGTPAATGSAGAAGADQGAGTIRQVQLSTFILDGDEFNFLQKFNFLHGKGTAKRGMIPDTWLLLDSQSTCGVVCNRNLLKNIVPCDPAVMHSQGGENILNQKGMLGSIECYLYEDGIANIVSLAEVQAKYKTTFDSSRGNCFIVHLPCGRKLRFEQSPEGLYYHDLAEGGFEDVVLMAKLEPAQPRHETTLVDTVAENMEGFSKRQLEGARRARDAYKTLGFPSMNDFIAMVRHNLIRNCPITVDDIKNAYKIYGPDVASLKGKTVRRASPVVRTDYIYVPRHIFEKHKQITLAADIMYVAGIKFLVTVSRGINLITSEFIPTRKKDNLKDSLIRAIRLYQNKGMYVTTALVDGEFDGLRGQLGSTDLNATAASEHVAEIERKLRLVKERFRALRSTLPFKIIPGRIIVEGVSFVVTWLNAFPSKTGASMTYSPRTIMTGTTLDFAKHCKTPFGSYCQVFQENTPSNTTKERTVAAICLGPTGNLQGSCKYFALTTKKKITRPQAIPLPMTDTIIAWVEKIAAEQQMPENIIFTTNRGEIVEVGDEYDDLGPLHVDDSEYFPTAISQECSDDEEQPELADIPQAVLEERLGITNLEPVYDNVMPTDGHHTIPHDDSELDDASEAGSSRLIGYAEHLAAESEREQAAAAYPSDLSSDSSYNPIDENTSYEYSSSNDSGSTGVHSTSTAAEQLGTPPRYPTRHRTAPTHLTTDRLGFVTNLTRGYHKAFTSIMMREAARTTGVSAPIESVLMTKAARFNLLNEFSYATMLDGASPKNLPEGVYSDTIALVAHKVMLHMALKKGLQEFGLRGEEAVSTELMQIHMQDTFAPKHFVDLTPEQRRKALESLIFLEEKKTGKIKGRMCADGSKQRPDFEKGEATSPTVITDSVIITSAVDAHEERDVAVIDLPGAFLHAEMDDVVHMVMRGKLAELMAETAPELYRKYITYGRNGEAILYVTLQKALYGCLKSALLFYKKLVSEIVSKGFELNPYDPCVANKIVNGRQMTITWHVDDLKISHADAAEVTKIIEWFKSIYGNVRVSRGPVHDYLGMNLDFTDKGKVKISMVPFLKKAIEEFPELITGSAATPATDRLFDVRPDEERKLLDEERARAFHHAVAQLLFATIRYRRDVQTTVAFLCTRVKSPDEDDWGKIKRLLRYLRGTLYLPLILEISNMSVIQWWVDASFATHPDCKGHTGAMMSLGKGAVMAMSKKQKINTKSSTESEIVGVDDASTSILWGNYFIAAQGFAIDETIVYQDNISSSYLLVNGKDSSSKRTKHMNVRYFFAKDRVKSGEMTIKHCPTKEMLADPFTKPLQGADFRSFRAVIMNCDPSIPDHEMSWERGETFARALAKSTVPRPQECVGMDDILSQVPAGTCAAAAG